MPGPGKPGLCCYRLQLGVRSGRQCVPDGEEPGGSSALSQKNRGSSSKPRRANDTIHHAKLSRHWWKLTGSAVNLFTHGPERTPLRDF